MNRRSFTLALALTLGAAAAACNRVPPLTHTFASADAVGAAVLEALAAGDRATLERLALSEQEFRDHVWPELPSARPERNMPFSYVWGDLHQKSQTSLSSVLSQRRGQRFALERVTFSGTTDYPSYRVHRQATLRVRDASGAETALRVCGSMIEKNGSWKVFSYVVDE